MNLPAQEKKAEAKEITVTGEIVDTVCFLKSGARGEKHKGCATSCAKAGIGLSVYDEKADKMYVVMGRGSNEKLLPFVAQVAKVTGKLHERSGQAVLELTSIAAAD